MNCLIIVRKQNTDLKETNNNKKKSVTTRTNLCLSNILNWAVERNYLSPKRPSLISLVIIIAIIWLLMKNKDSRIQIVLNRNKSRCNVWVEVCKAGCNSHAHLLCLYFVFDQLWVTPSGCFEWFCLPARAIQEGPGLLTAGIYLQLLQDFCIQLQRFWWLKANFQKCCRHVGLSEMQVHAQCSGSLLFTPSCSHLVPHLGVCVHLLPQTCSSTEVHRGRGPQLQPEVLSCEEEGALDMRRV